MSAPEQYAVWICTHCFTHLVNGDCTQPDDCHPARCWPLHPDISHPLHLLPRDAAPGLLASEHAEGCAMRNYPDVPAGYECDCETTTFSTSSCDGCASWLHGERHAVTVWSS